VESTAEGDWNCQLPPSDFTEADLYGTWHHQGASIKSERLIIRGDGKYKQIFEVSSSQPYESPWNSWWIEYRESGGLYLHLEGMRYTGSTDEVINLPQGGAGDLMFYDYCEQQIIRMEGEVILVIFGTEGSPNPFLASAPRGISLMNMSDEGDSGTTHFILDEHQGED
jgi:hypothetical protein